jgi:hypothetical protein
MPVKRLRATADPYGTSYPRDSLSARVPGEVVNLDRLLEYKSHTLKDHEGRYWHTQPSKGRVVVCDSSKRTVWSFTCQDFQPLFAMLVPGGRREVLVADAHSLTMHRFSYDAQDTSPGFRYLGPERSVASAVDQAMAKDEFLRAHSARSISLVPVSGSFYDQDRLILMMLSRVGHYLLVMLDLQDVDSSEWIVNCRIRETGDSIRDKQAFLGPFSLACDATKGFLWYVDAVQTNLNLRMAHVDENGRISFLGAHTPYRTEPEFSWRGVFYFPRIQRMVGVTSQDPNVVDPLYPYAYHVFQETNTQHLHWPTNEIPFQDTVTPYLEYDPAKRAFQPYLGMAFTNAPGGEHEVGHTPLIRDASSAL